MNEVNEIINGMQPLYEKAEKEGLWFWSRYQDLWFSPSELKEAQGQGRFLWGYVNWELRDPKEKIAQLQRTKSTIDEEIERFKSRI